MSETPARARWLRVLLAVGGALVVLVLLGLRPAIEGQLELDRAAAARASGEREAELRHLGRAARWRVPLLDHDERARAELWAFAEAAEQAGDLAGALAGYRELRRALLATRGVGPVDAAALERANAAIVALRVRRGAAVDRGAAADTPGSPLAQLTPEQAAELAAELAAEVAAELNAEPGPAAPRSHLAALAFVAWLAACVGFFTRGLDERGRLDARRATRWGGAVLVLLGIWLMLW